MRIVKLDHLVMYAADVDACIRFYKVLGFRIQDAKGRYELTAGDFRIHVYPKGSGPVVQPAKIQPGTLDICIELDGEVDMLRDYLASQGLEIAGEVIPRGGSRGVMRSFFVRDPDGNVVEIASYND